MIYNSINLEEISLFQDLWMQKILRTLLYYNNFCIILIWKYVKVKQSRYRPGQDQRVQRSWGSQISWHSAHEGGKFVSPTHRPPLPPGNIPGTVRGWVNPGAIVGPEGLYQRKIPMTLSGIEPANFRLEALSLNQLRHRVPQLIVDTWMNYWTRTSGSIFITPVIWMAATRFLSWTFYVTMAVFVLLVMFE